MKTKLLRKLRKRFFWFKRENKNFWSLYDNKTHQIIYCYRAGMYSSNDMLIYEMLAIIGMSHFYKGSRYRKEKRLNNKIILQNKFKKFFNT